MKKDVMLVVGVGAGRGIVHAGSVLAVHTLAANLVWCVRPRHDIHVEGLASC
jgi:hypothetical protein